mmetsp:Transcript_42070/g.84467  ORF Transcript_42070/g.84467 Transcript_42070/m.84467 type:complete len:214 (-) Transcript_42070:96-737(-)
MTSASRTCAPTASRRPKNSFRHRHFLSCQRVRAVPHHRRARRASHGVWVAPCRTAAFTGSLRRLGNFRTRKSGISQRSGARRRYSRRTRAPRCTSSTSRAIATTSARRATCSRACCSARPRCRRRCASTTVRSIGWRHRGSRGTWALSTAMTSLRGRRSPSRRPPWSARRSRRHSSRSERRRRSSTTGVSYTRSWRPSRSRLATVRWTAMMRC